MAQQGGLAVLRAEGHKACQNIVQEYLQNAAMLKQAFEQLGYGVYGGVHAPYVWVHFPKKTSWDVFGQLLEQTHIVCIPGSGFGSAGEGFIRVSAFAERDRVEEAVERLQKLNSK